MSSVRVICEDNERAILKYCSWEEFCSENFVVKVAHETNRIVNKFNDYICVCVCEHTYVLHESDQIFADRFFQAFGIIFEISYELHVINRFDVTFQNGYNEKWLIYFHLLLTFAEKKFGV